MTRKHGETKGANFEERLRSYFEQAGYFAVRGVPFRFDGESVTDVDVWLYERPNAIARRRLIVDAKNRTRPKAVERMLWLRGLQEGLGVDASILATTDKRKSVRQLASGLGIVVLDGMALERLQQAHSLDKQDRVPGEALAYLISRSDSQTSSKEWKLYLDAGKASLVEEFGFRSANQNLEAAQYFLEMSGLRSDFTRSVAARGFFLCSAYAAISLDFALRDLVFLTADQREEAVDLGLRFGDDADSSTLEYIRLATELVRQYADNGAAVARQIEHRIREQADSIPIDMIAEHVSSVGLSDALFRVARELESIAYTRTEKSYGNLSTDAKSFVSVLGDTFGVSRKLLATQLKVDAFASSGGSAISSQLSLAVGSRNDQS